MPEVSASGDRSADRPSTRPHDVVDVLAAAVDGVVARRIDGLSDEKIDRELRAAEGATRRLEARACRLVAERTRRARRRAQQERPDDPRAGERAAGRARREVDGMLNWSPGRGRRADRDALDLEMLETAGPAVDAGEISQAHARVLADTLKHFSGPRRDRLEAELLDAAKVQDPRTFGRTCRRRLIEEDHDAAMDDLNRQHARRRASVVQGDDGTVALHGRWAGLDAEIVMTAAHAFRRPDRSAEHRTPEQRTADAIVDALRAALRAREAPASHGVRPHVTVTVPLQTLLDRRGIAEADWTGPVPWSELRAILEDAGLAWLAKTVDGRPVKITSQTRAVPAGLWRMLVERDQGCIADGCDAPPRFCDVMHLEGDYAHGGILSLGTAGLGCRYHHRRHDLGNWQVTWTNQRPRLHPPQPRDGPSP
jgi:hypothetical protein